ncbi:MAG: Do family serine endopeptidase [Elusimicrobia bacterium]|nr:Do family serine endopeptidase [Elusimicrobiota bacterium]
MENLRKNLFWTVMVLGIVILAFIVGRSQRNPNMSLGIHTSASQEVLNLQEAFVNVVDELKPAVVSIYTKQVVKEVVPFNFFFSDPFENFFDEFFGQPAPQRKSPQQRQYRQREVPGAGSGVIIDKDGYILTNYHVVKNANKITVKLSNDKEYSGKVIGKDARTDLAVVKIKPRGKLTVAELGDSDKIRVGDWAIAIGSPFGLEQTVTVGVVSAKRQNFEVEGIRYKDFIQTDASINRGNSGGPLVNIHGQVIGINTAIIGPMGGSVGVGFAIPINNAKKILDPLITKGKVERGFLGVKIDKIDDVFAKQSGLKSKTGVVVVEVIPGLAADKAGIKRGDIILEFDGKKIDSVEKLQDVVSETAPSKKVKTVIWRDNSKKTFSVILTEWSEDIVTGKPESKKDENTAKWLGLEVKQFTDDMAGELGVSASEKGVVIVEIESGSKAEDMGLYVGDIVRAINRKKTTTIEEFKSAIEKVSLKEGILFDINRNGSLIYKTYIE